VLFGEVFWGEQCGKIAFVDQKLTAFHSGMCGGGAHRLIDFVAFYENQTPFVTKVRAVDPEPVVPIR